MNAPNAPATDPTGPLPVAAPAPDPDTDPQNTRTGRPPVLGTNQRKRLVALINAGCSRRAAARRIGCSPATVTQTIARDRQFADEVAQAESNLEVQLLQSLRNAAQDPRYWRAAGWLLERKYPIDYIPNPPRHYSAVQVVELFTATLETIRREITPEQRRAVIERLGDLLCQLEESPRRK